MVKRCRAGAGHGSLNAARRAREWGELARGAEVDVLIIGGGITGVGIALDAASRGLRVTLVERLDLAYGTTRYSSKLVHGGLRYLIDGDIGIARESARERRLLMTRIAPHLVNPMAQLLPLLPETTMRQQSAVRFGFFVNDVLRLMSRTSTEVLPRSRRVLSAEALAFAPAINPEGLRGGLVSWDGQLVDDARFVVAIARTAATFGARILTRVSAHGVNGSRAVLRDELTGESLAVRARAVINATGVWAGDIDSTISLRPRRGVHLVVQGEVFGGLKASVIVPIPGNSNRFVFALPAPHGRVYLGISEDPAHRGEPEVEQNEDAEVELLLATMSSVLSQPLTKAHVLAVFSGLRALHDDGDFERTANLARRHIVQVAESGVVSVVGGRFTTYRRMAEDAVDAMLAESSRLNELEVGPSRTKGVPLLGAATAAQLARIAAPPGLVARYGAEAVSVVELAGGDLRQLAPIAEGIDVCAAELLFGVRAEGALDVGDLLDRRTRIGLVPADRERSLAAAEQALEAGRSQRE